MEIYYLIFFFILGSFFGSFAHVLILRLPEEKSVIFPASQCEACLKKIPFYHNIPIISYLLLQGKCAFCKKSFSIHYLLTELLTAALFVFIYLKWGMSFLMIKYLVLSFLLVPLIFIDLKHLILPNELTYLIIILGFLFSFISYFWSIDSFNPLHSFFGLLVGGGFFYLTAYIFYALTQKEGLGGGDIKLLAGLGSFLGFKACLFIILTSSVIGMIGGLIFLSIKKKDPKTTEIPFGPYICFATYLYLFFPELSNYLFPVF